MLIVAVYLAAALPATRRWTRNVIRANSAPMKRAARPSRDAFIDH